MSLKVFKALANENRLKIVKILLAGEKCVSDFSKYIDKDFSVLCRHIKILQEANIVYIKKIGKSNVVCLKNPDLVKKLIDIAYNIEKGL